MEGEIKNRVANSKLITIDLEDYYPQGERLIVDISPWLYEGIILREKEFRTFIKNHQWEQYQDCYVAIHCSSEAIIPAWAYTLVSVHLNPFVKKSCVGSLNNLETILYAEIISELNFEELKDKPIIIKGCSNKPVPENAYLLLAQKILPFAKSIMYGEACSAVPLYKNK